LLLGCAAGCGYWLRGMKLGLGWLLPFVVWTYYVNWAKIVDLGQASWADILIVWADLFGVPGFKNSWVYGFGFCDPRPTPTNPLGSGF
jgi:hypothetical protein